jgi:hypothetical protein
MLQSEAVLRRASIDTSISLALTCLRGHFRTIPSHADNPAAAAGWYHYLDDQNPGITASAVGLYCFSLANVEFERTDQIVNYLVSRQIKAPTGGGWAVRTTNDFPIVEATAWVVRSLNLPQTRKREHEKPLIQESSGWKRIRTPTSVGALIRDSRHVSSQQLFRSSPCTKAEAQEPL